MNRDLDQPISVDAKRWSILDVAQYENGLVLETLANFIADSDNDAFAIRTLARGLIARMRLISSITHDVLNNEPFNTAELDELQGGMK